MQLQASRFSLSHTLESGQLFRYRPVDEGYLVSHRDKAFVISQDGDMLTVHASTPNVSREWLVHFFSLDCEPPQAVDEYSAEAIAYCGELRTCRQDPWECTIAFICSQNNNIKRIRQLMEGLAEAFGKEVKAGKHTAYLFPEPGAIKAGAKLSAIRAGYRERYLLEANKLKESWLRSLASLPYEEARQQLMTIKGVGPKVADCILLFSYGHRNAFPIDTWVQQIMESRYGGGTRKQMERRAAQTFGDDAGVLQQYLFHYERMRKR